MQITDILSQMGGLPSMARELGISEADAATGAEALVPALLGGFKNQVQSQGLGLEGLGGLLSQLGGGGLLDQVLSPHPTDVAPGNEVLGQIFGSPDVSRTVAQNAASQTGLDPSLLRKMLPMLAMLVAGYMAKQGGIGAPAETSTQDDTGGALGGGLGGLLGGLLNRASGANSPTTGGSQGGLGGLGAMLDMNGDGNSLDDILRMAGKALR
ncbi:MAG: hypothetical protein RLZZ618_3907 [Pseudomonadota bacterium]|jgi:hypothetical protein